MYIQKDSQFELTAEMKQKYFEIKLFITAEQIENIVITAIEGGINDWAVVNNSTKCFNNRPAGMPLSQFITQLLLQEETIELFDAEDEDERWQLSLTKLLRGVEIYVANAEECVDIDDIDSIDADVIFQYALFGEIVYG